MAIETILVKDAAGTDRGVLADKIGPGEEYAQVVKQAYGPDGTLTLLDEKPATQAAQTTANTALGAPADAEATGDGTIIGVLKRVRALLGTIATAVTGTLTVGGSVAVSNLPATQTVSGNVGVTGNVEVTNDVGNPLPTSSADIGGTADAAASSDTGNFSLIALIKRLNTKLGALGQQNMAGSQPVVIASNQSAVPTSSTDIGAQADAAAGTDTGTFSLIALVKRLLGKFPGALGPQSAAASLSVVQSDDTTVTGPAAQSAINVDLLTGTVNGWYDARGFQSGSIQIVAGAGISAGAVIFEQTNDTSLAPAGGPLRAYEATSINANPNVAAITIAASTARIFTVPVNSRFIRARISTAFVGGTVQASATLSQRAASFPTVNVQQATAGNLNVTVGGTLPAIVGQGASGAALAGNPVRMAGSDGTNTRNLVTDTAGNLLVVNPLPFSIADVASAALTATTTTAAFTPSFGNAYEVNIPVTVVTGTTPTLDVGIEESDDGGTNWFRVYDFPRITATGIYRSPKLPLTGNRVRYVQTVGGTTPSFTRAINRLQSIESVPPIRQLVDRALAVNTINSVTASLNAQNCRNVQLIVDMGAVTTTPPQFQIEASDNNGATWYAVGSPLVSAASTTGQLTVANVQAQLYRARVSTAGVGATLNSVTLKGF